MRAAVREAQRATGSPPPPPRRPRRWPGALAALTLAAVLGGGLWALLLHPDTPLPPEWNPTRSLEVAHPVTPLTGWKLDRAAASGALCRAALGPAGQAEVLPDVEASEQCHIRDRVRLSRVGEAAIGPVETRCAVALRLAMWERHALQPEALARLGSPVARIEEIGSYNCRAMRLASGETGRMSTHATAEALDVTGVVLDDGRRLRLLADWSGDGPEAGFLKAARDGACDWFETVLSPDYNSLHADHFHLQSRGWGLCR